MRTCTIVLTFLGILGTSCGDNAPSVPGIGNCGGQSVNFLTDPRNCGACGRACGGGTPLCSSGNCVAACPAGQMMCGSSCVEPSTDTQQCGD